MRSTRGLHALATALVAVGLTVMAGTAPAATFIVTTTADSNDGACTVALCSLRDAIIAANGSAGADIITRPAGTYTLSIAGAGEDLAATGDLDIVGDVTINGAGAGTTIVDGGAIDRVFHVVAGAVAINDVTIRNGLAPGLADGGGILVAFSATLGLDTVALTNNHTAGGIGGAILNNGTTTIANSTVTANGTGGGGGGGGINNQNTMIVTATTISANTTGAGGGSGAGVNNSADMTLTGSSVTGNHAGGGGNGGGVFNSSTLSIDSTPIDNNAAGPVGGNGGGVYNSDDVTITNGTINSNTTTAGGNGAGVYNSSTASITSVTISGNSTAGGGNGGGVYDIGLSATLTAVTVSGNTAGGGDGGGLFSGGVLLTTNNTTVTGNSAGLSGGGLFHEGSDVVLNNTTLAGNTGGGIFHNGGTVTLKNTIIASNGANCSGTLPANGGTNLQFPGTTCGAAIPSADPLLQGLANNGGPTLTMALGAGSPAIDAGTTGCPPTPATDQRGVARPQGPGCDIGAFESSGAPPVPSLSINNATVNEGNGGTTSLVFTVTLSAASASTVTVGFATADGSANAGSDYSGISGTLTFTPGVTTQTISVSVNGDTTVEPNETLSVNLAAPTNATIASGSGTGTIVNDDGVVANNVPVPTLNGWAMTLLALLMATFAAARIGRRKAR
jgi:CSLREA domain-containing protein